MTQIRIGVRYTPAHVEWDEVIADLREGDEVEAWFGDIGSRAALWPGDDSDLVAQGRAVRLGGAANGYLAELTVTKLAPRKPDWWGAKVIRDADSEFLIRTADGRYLDSYGSTYTDEETDEPEIRTVIDADGNLTWDAVEAEFGERIREGVYDGLQPVYPTYSGVFEAIRAACGGGPK